MTVERLKIAAEEQLRRSLETTMATTPILLEWLRTQQLMMRDSVGLVKQSRYLSIGDQEEYLCNQFIQHLNKGTYLDGFPNPATRANVVDKMKMLRKHDAEEMRYRWSNSGTRFSLLLLR
jgi:hypothetical protein